MAVRPEKQAALQRQMDELGILESDLEERFILGSGKGGQKLNKTSSCVYLKHTPSGVEVKCQKDRSQEINRFLARRQLCELYEEKILHKKTKKTKEIDKIRKQKKRRSRRRKTDDIPQDDKPG